MRLFIVIFVLFFTISVSPFMLADQNINLEGSETGYEHAMSLLHQGVIFEAVHEMENFTEVHPDNEQAHMQLAIMLQKVGRDRRAAEEAGHVLHINPDNAAAHRMLTSIMIKLEQRLDRSDPVAVLDYARLCSKPDSYDRAADYYELYFSLKDDPAVRIEFARMLYWAGRYADAEREAVLYLKYNPNDIKGHLLLGRIYAALGSFDAAVIQYRKSLTGGVDDVDIELDIARCLLWSGKDKEAEAILRKIRKRSNEYDAPLLLLASIARMQGKIEAEYRLYKEVLKSNPSNREARKRIAVLERGSLLEETRYLNHLLDNPDDIETRRKLVRLYLDEKRYGEAIPHLEVLNRRLPGDSGLTKQLQLARRKEKKRVSAEVSKLDKYMDKKDSEEIERCKKWLGRNPNDYKTRVRLVDLMMRNRQYKKAADQLEILDSMTPSNPHIMEKLSQVSMLMQANASQETKRAQE